MFSAHSSVSAVCVDKAVIFPSRTTAFKQISRSSKVVCSVPCTGQPVVASAQLLQVPHTAPTLKPVSQANNMVGTLNGTLNGALNGTVNGTCNGGVILQHPSYQLHDDIERLLFTPEQIAKRVNEVGRQLAKEYADKEPVFLVVLTGAFMFASDLLRAVSPVPAGLRVEFIRASSYGHGSQSCGEVTLKSNVDPAVVKDRHVVVVEDIIDSGLTLQCLVGYLDSLGVASVKSVTLLDKKERRTVDYKADYACFECPNEFVVGYGLDFAEQYRSLPYVGVLKEHLYK